MGPFQSHQRRDDLEEEKEGENMEGNQKKIDRKRHDNYRKEDRGCEWVQVGSITGWNGQRASAGA